MLHVVLLGVWNFGMGLARGVHLASPQWKPWALGLYWASLVDGTSYVLRNLLILCDFTEKTLDIFHLVSSGFCPTQLFPLLILLSILSTRINLSPEYNYMLSPLCPPPKSPTKSSDGLGQPQHKFLLTDVCFPWTDISNNGSLGLNSSFYRNAFHGGKRHVSQWHAWTFILATMNPGRGLERHHGQIKMRNTLE